MVDRHGVELSVGDEVVIHLFGDDPESGTIVSIGTDNYGHDYARVRSDLDGEDFSVLRRNIAKKVK